MDVQSILAPASVLCDANATSKKHAMELLSQLLADAVGTLNATEVFDSLVNRERLGCTGLGGSVAIPHSKIAGIDECVGAFMRLSNPVDFDACDGEPVDLVFGLLIPADCNQEELDKLRTLSEFLASDAQQALLREATDANELHRVLSQTTGKELPVAAQA